MNTSEVLNLAADLIEKRGWAAGGGQAADSGPLCVEQAILVAEDKPIADGAWVGSSYSNPATIALRSYLGLDGSVWAWNDSLPYRPDTTFKGGSEAASRVAAQSEVIEVLRAAAAIEESRETAAIIAGALQVDVVTL